MREPHHGAAAPPHSKQPVDVVETSSEDDLLLETKYTTEKPWILESLIHVKKSHLLPDLEAFADLLSDIF